MSAPRKPPKSGTTRPAAGVNIDGKRLTELRIDRLMSRQQLAEAADVSVPAVAAYENEERRPRVATLAKLCAALGIQPGDLTRAPA